MFTQERLSFEPLPLPDRHDMSDEQMLDAAQNFYGFMKRRHSVRDYSTRPVAREVVESCMLAAGTAPSGANHQPWHFVAISNAEHKHRIRLAAEEEEKKFYSGGAGDEWLKALEPVGTDDSKPHLDLASWIIVIFAQRYGRFEDGQQYKNYYVSESVGIATRLPDRRAAPRWSGHADPYAQPYELSKRALRPPRFRETGDDPRGRPPWGERHGPGHRQDQEAARRACDDTGVGRRSRVSQRASRARNGSAPQPCDSRLRANSRGRSVPMSSSSIEESTRWSGMSPRSRGSWPGTAIQ